MANAKDIDTQIAQTNQRLKAAQFGLQIERRGQKLSLRGTLPPRPDSVRLRPCQQRISLGLPATAAGLKQAEQRVKVIAAELIQNTFDWRNYTLLESGKILSAASLAEQIAAFEQQFFRHPRRTSNPASARTTWETAYAPYLRKLQTIAQSHPTYTLPEAIYATVQSIDPNSRSRQVCCTALNALATFLKLDLPRPLKSFWGIYNPSHTQTRNLPSDELIAQIYEHIPNLAWRFVYGVMATYGLRNHEVFFCDYGALVGGDREATVQVLNTTKTGSHEVWPFYPEWVEQFGLRDLWLPPLNTDLTQTTLQRIGQQVSLQFRRYNIPFSPYDLRHAWAVRTIHFGLPDTVAARMMGHSVAIHTRTYHQWITRRDQQQAVATAIGRSQLKAPVGGPKHEG